MLKHHNDPGRRLGVRWLTPCCRDPYSCAKYHKTRVSNDFFLLVLQHASISFVLSCWSARHVHKVSVLSKWCHEFKNGRMSVHDDQKSRRPSIHWRNCDKNKKMSSVTIADWLWMNFLLVGLGGLGEHAWDPRFAGSNPTEVDGFFQNIKILSNSSPGGTLSWGSWVWDFRLVKEPQAWKNRPLSKI